VRLRINAADAPLARTRWIGENLRMALRTRARRPALSTSFASSSLPGLRAGAGARLNPPTCVALVALVALAAAALSGCAGVGEDTATTSEGPPAVERRDDATLRADWGLFLGNSEEWPAAREQWLAGPPAERRILLDNLLIELLKDDDADRGSGTSFRSARARRELAWFGSEAIPPLAEGMRALGSRERVDGVTLDRIATALVELRAVAELARISAPPAAADGEGGGAAIDVRARVAAVRALDQIELPEARTALIDRVLLDPEWQVRGAAAECLKRRAGDPEVRRVMLAALGDSDGFVRAEAVRALVVGTGTEIESIPLDRLARCLVADPESGVRAAAAESLGIYAFAPEVEELLLRSLADPDLAVVNAAAHALFNNRTRAVQLALVDALERVNRIAVREPRAAGVVSELLRLLSASVGASPERINPAGWRALIEQRWQER
jgi:hypothetical protein